LSYGCKNVVFPILSAFRPRCRPRFGAVGLQDFSAFQSFFNCFADKTRTKAESEKDSVRGVCVRVTGEGSKPQVNLQSDDGVIVIMAGIVGSPRRRLALPVPTPHPGGNPS